MKKFLKITLAILLASVLLCGLARVNSGASAVSKKAVFSVDTATGHPGDTVTVKVNLSNNPGITAVGLKLSWDAEKLEYIKYADGIIPRFLEVVESAAYFIITLMTSDVEPSFENGTLLELTFKIKENAAPGSVPVILTIPDDAKPAYDQFTDADFEIASGGGVNVVDASVTIEPTDNNSGARTEGNNTWLIIIIIAAVVVVAAIIIFVAHKKRKGKRKSKGKRK